ncbi:MAG: hypothetical protein KJ655_04815, partial [Candidatus Thermoplasmatota archaeon]|nr:hypothetical protein [Candidatus Thermoplasmatota archaeon]
MSIIEIFMYSIGSVFFFSALAFTYYSIQCARVMRGALGRKMMACGALLFIIAGIIGAIDAFFFPGSGLVYCSFSVWITALITLLIGGFLAGKAIQKVYPVPLIKTAFTFKRGIYYLIAFLVLTFIGIPAYLLDNLRPLETEFSWYSVISIVIWAFCFVALAIGAKMDYKAVAPSAAAAAAGGEIALLRDDILAVRGYGAMTNMFLVTAKPALGDKPLRDVLTEYFEYNPLLFEGCKIKDDGTVNTEPIIKNLDRISEENRVQLLCSTFSILNSKIMNLYGAVTSSELAKKRLEESYLYVKKLYGDLPVFFDILRSLPAGILKEERFGLLSKEELEVMVRVRTIELEKALEDVKKAKAKVEKLAKLEKERADELKDARDVTLSVLEDTDEAKRELEKAKVELEKAKTGLEEKVKERSAELEQTYQKLVKTESAAAADKARAEEAEKYTKELKKAYEELKTLDKMKSDFISIAAHELRTPLTPVRAYIELIKAGKLGRTEWR